MTRPTAPAPGSRTGSERSTSPVTASNTTSGAGRLPNIRARIEKNGVIRAAPEATAQIPVSARPGFALQYSNLSRLAGEATAESHGVV